MKELLEKCPKTAKLVRAYYLEKLLNSLEDKNLPDEFKEHVRQQGLQGGIVEEVLENSSRQLFDFFDENGLFICINALSIDQKNIEFNWSIHNFERNTIDIIKYSTRKEAEDQAITKAFELLENKL